MKRVLLFLLATLYITSITHAEEIFQLYNGDFESWEIGKTGTNKKVGDEPSGWSSYLTVDGASSFLMNAAASKDQCARSTSTRPGSKGQYSGVAIAGSVLGIVANGMLTTGTIYAGSASPTDTKNHNYTKTSDPTRCMHFTGRPDSITVWYKNVAVKKDQLGRIYILLHGNYDTQDPGTNWNEVVAVAGTDPEYCNTWKRLSLPFCYYGSSMRILNESGETTLTPKCQDERPSYALASFATNYKAGKGTKGDSLYLDDVVMIYNSKLATLAVNGTSVAGFDKDKYNYTVSSTYSNSSIECTSDGKFATIEKDYNPSTNVLTITVKGDDYEATQNAHTYTIQFATDCQPLLTDFTVNGKTISGFSSNTFNYNLSEVYANVTVKETAASCATSSSSWDEATQTYTVKVSANNVSNTYKFTFHADYGSQLTSLKIEGETPSGFSPSTYSYTVNHAYREDGLSYTADDAAIVEESYNEKTHILTLTVKGGDFASNATNTHTYTIQYHAPYESLLTDFKFFGVTLSGFAPTKTSYETKYAFEPADTSYSISEGASVVADFNSATNLLTLTVNGYDVAVNPTNKHTYTIQCHAPYSSQLTSLAINGVSVKGFSASKYSYSTDASYVDGTTSITWKNPDDATATGSYDANTNSYTIVVKGGDFEWNEKNFHNYVIAFHEAYGSKLKEITIDGLPMEGFDPNTFEYNLSRTYTSTIDATPDDGADMTPSYDPSTYTMTYVVNGADIASNPSNTHTYKVHFHAPYGSYLKSLSINGNPVSGFAKTKMAYEVSETYTNDCVSYEADEEATVTTSYDSNSNVFVITVKGGDIATNTSNTHTYRITFHAAYGSQLTSLKVNGATVENFSPDVYTYSLMSSYDENKTVVTFLTDEDAQAKASFDKTTNIYSIVVSGGDIQTNPTNTHTYTIAFHDSYGSQLTSLSVNGATIEGFSPSVYQYTLPDAYDPSSLTYTTDAEATVEKTDDARNYTVTLKVKGGDYLENSSNTHTYTIQFHAPYASQLTSLTNNGVAIPGFSANIYNYSVSSTFENSKIEYTVSEDATHESSFDKEKNVLTIVVKGGDIASNTSNYHTYTIGFHDEYGSQLTSIKVDRISLEEFAPDQYSYLVEKLYDNNVTCEADAEATYTMNFDESTKILTIVVSGGDITSNPTNKHTYTLQFESPSLLTSLKVDGTMVSNFRDSKYSYSMTTYAYENVKVTYTASEGASVDTLYDSETGLLSLIVKGSDIKIFPNNTHTYTIQFHASYSSYLTNLTLNGTTLEGFEKKKLNYLVKAPYRDFKVNATPDMDAKTKISFDDKTNMLTITVNGGDIAENPSNFHIYTIQFYAPSQLANAKINGLNLSGFKADTYYYDVQPNAYEDVKFAVYEDETAHVDLLFDESTNTATATVYGADFDTYPDNKHIYQFQFSEPYVASLLSLVINETSMELPEFNSKPYKTTMSYDALYKDVTVTPIAKDKRSTISSRYDENNYQLTIRVEGGNITQVSNNYAEYVIQFNDPTNYGSQLQSLTVNGTLLSGFASDKYSYTLDGSYSDMKISYTADEKAIISEQFDENSNSLILTVKGGNYEKDNTNVHTYTLKFTAQFSYGSQITNLYLDGGEDKLFSKDNYNYTIQSEYKGSAITFAVNSLAQYCEYYDDEKQTLTIVVWGGDFATNSENFHTYVFNFEK